MTYAHPYKPNQKPSTLIRMNNFDVRGCVCVYMCVPECTFYTHHKILCAVVRLINWLKWRKNRNMFLRTMRSKCIGRNPTRQNQTYSSSFFFPSFLLLFSIIRVIVSVCFSLCCVNWNRKKKMIKIKFWIGWSAQRYTHHSDAGNKHNEIIWLMRQLCIHCVCMFSVQSLKSASFVIVTGKKNTFRNRNDDDQHQF